MTKGLRESCVTGTLRTSLRSSNISMKSMALSMVCDSPHGGLSVYCRCLKVRIGALPSCPYCALAANPAMPRNLLASPGGHCLVDRNCLMYLRSSASRASLGQREMSCSSSSVVKSCAIPKKMPCLAIHSLLSADSLVPSSSKNVWMSA